MLVIVSIEPRQKLDRIGKARRPERRSVLAMGVRQTPPAVHAVASSGSDERSRDRAAVHRCSELGFTSTLGNVIYLEQIDRRWPSMSESSYHFRISLRVRHPEADPARITDTLGMIPRRAWKAGEFRQTPTGTPLQGSYPASFWYVEVLAGRCPDSDLPAGVQKVLDRLTKFRDFFHTIRLEGGSVELFIGWFFERQSGDVFTHAILAKAADLKIDLSFDVYPPTQPQNEYEVADSVLPP